MTIIDTNIDHLIEEIDAIEGPRLSIRTRPIACNACGTMLVYVSRQHLPIYWEADDTTILGIAERFSGSQIVEAPANAVPVRGSRSVCDKHGRKYIPKWPWGRKNRSGH